MKILLLFCFCLSVFSQSIEVPLIDVQNQTKVGQKFSVYVENDSWKDLEYKNIATGEVFDTKIDDPIAFTWDHIFLAYVENDSWKDLEYINMHTHEKKDSRIDNPLKIAVYKNLLFFVENSSWKDLEYVDMLTGEVTDTRIDNPSYLKIENGYLVTDEGKFKLP